MRNSSIWAITVSDESVGGIYAIRSLWRTEADAREELSDVVNDNPDDKDYYEVVCLDIN
jgi:hypothetical protein